jgi:hypothetical protein
MRYKITVRYGGRSQRYHTYVVDPEKRAYLADDTG